MYGGCIYCTLCILGLRLELYRFTVYIKRLLSVFFSPHVFKEQFNNRGLCRLELLIKSVNQGIVVDVKCTLLTKKVKTSWIEEREREREREREQWMYILKTVGVIGVCGNLYLQGMSKRSKLIPFYQLEYQLMHQLYPSALPWMMSDPKLYAN